MIRPLQTIAAVKADVEQYYMQPVRVKLNLGRNKYAVFSAVLSGIYPSIFTVSPQDKNFLGKTAYSYAEILCGKVSLSADDEKVHKRAEGDI